MRKRIIGILAHVDAGKTTLSESLLYNSGTIRKLGRVDDRDAFLDIHEMERERGITIFSKQAELNWLDLPITLLDTPGHVDFSAEAERTLQVLDMAILVISGADGVQGHTATLWRLLKQKEVPVFLFVNKMDQPGTDKEVLLKALQKELDGGIVDFTEQDREVFCENIAVSDERVLEYYMEQGDIPAELICALVGQRKIFPCYFGSALRNQGVTELLQGIYDYSGENEYPEEFGARVFKIARDPSGNRLTYMKITGGTLKARDVLQGMFREKPGKNMQAGSDDDEEPREEAVPETWEEKVTQIRIYSGEKFKPVPEAPAGTVCAVTGLSYTEPGMGLGIEADSDLPVLTPVLMYRLILPPGVDAASMMPKLAQLEEEEPLYHVVWDELLREIQVRIMGEVQLEILARLIRDRFGIEVEFGQGSVVYRETIADPVVGVGHFEPLRHYAEVHLLMEPGDPGSGITFATDCREEILAKNWQRLILTHLEEKEHRGVLTGAPITDIKITVVGGRAHQKHTEGGDFRKATYRAVRQGLMSTRSVLLEPWYDFRLELPEQYIGRAMTDIARLGGTLRPEENEGGFAVLCGSAPVSAMRGYQKELNAYSQGRGRLIPTLKGYYPCHNGEEVIREKGYDPESDLRNPSGSVFCAHGSGFVVPWDQVRAYMQAEDGVVLPTAQTVRSGAVTHENAGFYEDGYRPNEQTSQRQTGSIRYEEDRLASIGTDEIDAILNRTSGANRRSDNETRRGIWRKKKPVYVPAVSREYKPAAKLQEYLLVDGYNVIFAWPELAELAERNIDGARGRLQDILCDYAGVRGGETILVFDAYRVEGHDTEIFDYHNIHVVYTREAETADAYIERFAHENSRKYHVTVATSDGLEQIIIRGAGCDLLSSRDLLHEVERTRTDLRQRFMEKQTPREDRHFLFDGFEDIVEQFRNSDEQN